MWRKEAHRQAPALITTVCGVNTSPCSCCYRGFPPLCLSPRCQLVLLSRLSLGICLYCGTGMWFAWSQQPHPSSSPGPRTQFQIAIITKITINLLHKMWATAHIAPLSCLRALRTEGLPAQILGDQPSSLLGDVQDAIYSQHCLAVHIAAPGAGLDSAHQGHGSVRAQGTASSGAQRWTSSRLPFSQPAAAPCWAPGWKFPGQFPGVRPGPAAPQRAGRCGAGSQRLNCSTPGSLIKQLAAASLPAPAQSSHGAEVQLEMLSSTEVRGECASPRRAAPLWPQPLTGSEGAPVLNSCWKTQGCIGMAEFKAGGLPATTAPWGIAEMPQGKPKRATAVLDCNSQPGTCARAVSA